MQNLPNRSPIPLAVLLALAGCNSAGPEKRANSGSTSETVHTSSVVEAACGECQFGLPGSGCDLAVRIDGQAYFVDGTKIDDHGDAHADDGFCNAIRRARVTGEMVDGRFVAHSFELMPEG